MTLSRKIAISLVVGFALVLATYGLSRTTTDACSPDSNFGLDVIGYSNKANVKVRQHGLPLSYYNDPIEQHPNAASIRDCDDGLLFIPLSFVIDWAIFASISFFVLVVYFDLRKEHKLSKSNKNINII